LELMSLVFDRNFGSEPRNKPAQALIDAMIPSSGAGK
jgi:hypothetical protein